MGGNGDRHHRRGRGRDTTCRSSRPLLFVSNGEACTVRVALDELTGFERARVSPHYSRGFVTKPPRRHARRARGAARERSILEQYVDRQSGEPARRQACRSGVSAVAVEAFVNGAGELGALEGAGGGVSARRPTFRTLFSAAALSRLWLPSDRAHRCRRKTAHR